MVQRMPRLIDDMRRRRKLYCVSFAVAVAVAAACAACHRWGESEKLRKSGAALVSGVAEEYQQVLEATPESLSGDLEKLRFLSERIANVPESPRCATRNAIAFLRATRTTGLGKESSNLAKEYENAVSEYSGLVKDLRRGKQSVDELAPKLEDAGDCLFVRYLETVNDLRNDISAFREVCNRCFISGSDYAIGESRLSAASAKMRKLLESDSAMGDIKMLMEQSKSLLKDLNDMIGAIGMSEQRAKTAEAKLRELQYDASHAEKMWTDQVQAFTNAIMASSRIALQELPALRAPCVKAIDAAREALVKARGSVKTLQEKFPDCIEASDFESLSRRGRQIEELQEAMDGAIGTCRDAMTKESENAARTLVRLNLKAARLLRGVDRVEQEWIALFNELGSLESMDSSLSLDAMAEEMTKIRNDAKKIEEGISDDVKRIQSAAQGRWNDRAKPRIRLVARLNGVEKHARVTSGIMGSDWVTPVDGIEEDVGRRIKFAVEYTEDGVKYVGEMEHAVRMGGQTVAVEMRPEFTLPYDLRFCGNCGGSLEKHRHVRRCPFCSSYLEK